MFPTSGGKRGYDEAFLYEIPADLTCTICSFVLRDPVQLDCGDRFCAPCFGNLVEYSERSGSELLCPADRQPIEKEKIFSDRGVTRTIKNLQVKCRKNELGCKWSGGLVDLECHGASCQFQATAPSDGQDTELKDLCKQLLERVQRCEENSALKEKELAHLQFTIKEMKENYSTNEEVKGLKEELIYLKLTVRDMKDGSYENNEMGTLRDSVTQLETKVENLMKEKKETAQKYMSEVEQLRKKILHLENQLQNVSSVEEIITTNQMYTNEQISLVKENFENENIDQRLETFSDNVKNLNRKFENIRKEIKSNRNPLDKASSEKEDEVNENKNKIKDLQNHVKSLEDVLFLFNSVGSENVHFKWVMANFKEHYAIGEDVSSPVFYTDVSGYCFQFVVYWTEDEVMGVYLQLHRGRNENGERNLNLPPLNYECTLTLFNKNGGYVKKKIARRRLEDLKDSCFLIPVDQDPAEDCSIKSPFDDYVFNDAVYVMCTLHNIPHS